MAKSGLVQFNPLGNPFVSSSTSGQTTNFRLHNEQTVNGLRKIAWASVFFFKRQHIYICSFKGKMETQSIFLNPFTVMPFPQKITGRAKYGRGRSWQNMGQKRPLNQAG
jgi:hypothetical protein